MRDPLTYLPDSAGCGSLQSTASRLRSGEWREAASGRGSEEYFRGNGMDPPGSERKGARVRNRERGSAMRWSGREGVTACQAAFRPRRTPCREPRDVGRCGFFSVPSGFRAGWEMIGLGQCESREMCYRQVLGSR